MNIIERKVLKFSTLHLKCFPGFMQQLENLVFVEFFVKMMNQKNIEMYCPGSQLNEYMSVI